MLHRDDAARSRGVSVRQPLATIPPQSPHEETDKDGHGNPPTRENRHAQSGTQRVTTSVCDNRSVTDSAYGSTTQGNRQDTLWHCTRHTTRKATPMRIDRV